MRRGIVLIAMCLLWSLPAAAQFVAPGGAIPAVANIRGPGVFWRSDVSILNLSSADTTVVLLLFPELTNAGPAFEPLVSDPIDIVGNGQITLPNVVTDIFGLRNAKGGLQVISGDGSPLVLASRTYTSAATGGSYGLNVYGLPLIDTETAWLANVAEDSAYRTNVGIFLPIDPPAGNPLVFTVTVHDNEGAEVASGSVIFDQAGLRQESLEYFGVDQGLTDGWVEFRCSDPSYVWYAYATVIDNLTGDSVYRSAIGQQAQ